MRLAPSTRARVATPFVWTRLAPLVVAALSACWLIASLDPAGERPALAQAGAASTPTPTAAPTFAEPVVPAATRSVAPVPPRPGQPTWTPVATATPSPSPTATATPTPPVPPPSPASTATGTATPEPTPMAGLTPSAGVASPTPASNPATATPRPAMAAPDAGLTTVPARFGYGVNVVVPDVARMQRASEAGFEWMKVQLAWADAEPEAGRYAWNITDQSTADVYAGAAASVGLKLVVRVDRPPGWANGNRGPHAPSDSPAAYGRFLRALAEHLRGRVVAYELWNEPNLAWEWGDRDPDPAAFAHLLSAGYDGVKAGDPNALVISGALVATGWTKSGIAMDDLDFLRGMARAGARFDALGVHPYGYAASPEGFHDNGILEFRRAEAWRQVMEEVGWRDRPMWATEFNWLVDPYAEGADCSWPDRDWQRVTPEHQADYLVRAFNYARDHWPWMGPMFVFNLDMAMAPTSWSPACEQMRWYSLLRPDGAPRPAYYALRDMPKPAR